MSSWIKTATATGKLLCNRNKYVDVQDATNCGSKISLASEKDRIDLPRMVLCCCKSQFLPLMNVKVHILDVWCVVIPN